MKKSKDFRDIPDDRSIDMHPYLFHLIMESSVNYTKGRPCALNYWEVRHLLSSLKQLHQRGVHLQETADLKMSITEQLDLS